MADKNETQASKEQQQFCLMLDTPRWEWLRTAAFQRKRSMADMVREMIDRARSEDNGQGHDS